MNYEDLFEGPSDPFAPIPVQTQEPKKLNPGNDKDRQAMWEAAGNKALSHLYQHDPLIREELLAQVAKSKLPDPVREKESLVLYDEVGNIKGLKKDVIRGAYATGRDQLEVMEAIRRESHRIHGIKE